MSNPVRQKRALVANANAWGRKKRLWQTQTPVADENVSGRAEAR
jgi:hypothetical protein